MRYIYKLLRVTAWTLLVLMPVTLFSGFFMLKHFLVPWFSYDLAAYIHTNLPVVLLILLVYIHSMAGILVIFQRHPKWNINVYKIPVTIFWTLLFLTMIWLFVAQPPSKNAQTPVTQTAANIQVNYYTIADIAVHNNVNDCWLLINNKVYDVTSFIPGHPGGERNIADSCGRESTAAYDTKNKGTPHSAYANDLLQNYYIGDLKN